MKTLRKLSVMVFTVVLCLCAISAAFAEDGEDADILVKGIKFETTKVTVNVGETISLNPTVTPENATDSSLSWSSSDSSIVNVDGNGKITAMAAGTVTVTATANDASSKTASVTVFVPEICTNTTEYTITKMNPDAIYINFYGASPENLSVKMTGNVFDYTRDYPENQVKFTITPLRIGTGTLVIDDLVDKSKITLTINVEQTAIKNNKTVLITSASVKKGSTSTGVNVKLENTGTKEVVAYSMRIDYLNKFNEIERLYVTDNGDYNLPEYAAEAKEVLKVERTKSIVGGKTTTFSESYIYSGNHAEYSPENINVAICWYRLADGTEVTIPENQLAWYSSEESKYIVDPYVDEASQYEMPDASLLDKANSSIWGYSSVSVYSTQYEAWCLNHSGQLLTSVVGHAEDAGLEVYDLIWAVNGITWEEDPFIMERAKVMLMEGEEVTFSVERFGEDIEIKVKG